MNGDIGKVRDMTQRILIIGITGGAGHEIAKVCLAADFQVRALHRKPEMLSLDHRIDVIQGNAMSAEDVLRAAEGCSFIFNGANPPNYSNWHKLVIPMAMSAAEAALAVNARLLVPGNIYNFGPDSFPVIYEGAQQTPLSGKGQVRVDMEQALKNSGARVTILRAGDFFGGHAPASWFQTTMIKPGKPVKKVIWPGTGAGHAFAYLPDLARTFVRLMQEDEHMKDFEDLNFSGHYLEDGRDFARAILRAAGRPENSISALPWPVIGLARPLVSLFREIWEMRYLWQTDISIDNARLKALIGQEPYTQLDEALRASLAELGCIQSDTPWTEAPATLFSG
jgi:nucleoside-diphosphate-sugar epimerase